MNRYVSNSKWLVFCLLSFALATSAVFGGNADKADKREDKVAASHRSVVVAENRRALEAYEKRNAEIAPWPEDAAPPNTDNAALLYYQACLLVPEPNEALKHKIRPNAGPTPEIRTYLGKCLPVIEIAQTASRIPECTWAVWPGARSSLAPVRKKILLLATVLLMDATTLAVDEKYNVALERCLTVQRIARHLSDDPELYTYEEFFFGRALYTIQILLGMMPPDQNILTWFRDELVRIPKLPFSSAKRWRGLLEIGEDRMRTDTDALAFFRAQGLREARGQQAKESIQNLTDKQFRSRAAEVFTQIADSILEIISSNAIYDKRLSKVHQLYNELTGDGNADPIVKTYASLANMAEGLLTHQVEQKAWLSGTKAAVEIYIELAKTGKLPEKLPANLPKDPFTGKDFGYEKTDDGFALRCAGQGFKKRKKSLLEFRVRR